MAYNDKKIKKDIGLFIKQYKRTSRKSFDPNDRSYDRKPEQKIKQMNPEELSKLITGEE